MVIIVCGFIAAVIKLPRVKNEDLKFAIQFETENDRTKRDWCGIVVETKSAQREVAAGNETKVGGVNRRSIFF